MTNPVVAPPPTDATADTFPAVREALKRWYNAMFDIWGRDKTFVGTLTPGAASTTFIDARITPTSMLLAQACTANAAAAVPTMWVDETTRTRGAVTVNHVNSAVADRTFRWTISGT